MTSMTPLAISPPSPGPQVCSIPGPAILTGDGDGSEAALAERLLAERRRGAESFFEPYISGLEINQGRRLYAYYD